MVFPACDKPAVVVQPGDGSLDDPTPFVPPEFAAILFRRPHTSFAMRTNQSDSLLTKTINLNHVFSPFATEGRSDLITPFLLRQICRQQRFLSN